MVEDTFPGGTSFQQVIDLYLFDKSLRSLYLDAIECIEVGLRVEIALRLGARNRFAVYDPDEFDKRFSMLPSRSESQHARWLMKQADKYQRSNEEFVKHFKSNYQGFLPIWMAIELWDFGMLSVLLGGMKSTDRFAISAPFNLLRPDILPSWTRNLNVVRNICAHHGRLWNRSLSSAHPILSRRGEIPSFDHLIGDSAAQGRVYASAAILQHLQSVIHPSSGWKDRLSALIACFPRSGPASEAQAGFPAHWNTLPLWQ